MIYLHFGHIFVHQLYGDIAPWKSKILKLTSWFLCCNFDDFSVAHFGLKVVHFATSTLVCQRVERQVGVKSPALKIRGVIFGAIFIREEL